MIDRLRRSLSFRLLAIFLVLALAFIYFATVGIRWVFQEDDLRELISGHLSLHVNYVKTDIGNPPRIERSRGGFYDGNRQWGSRKETATSLTRQKRIAPP